MTLSQIRDFIAVVESGGIRAAARKLGVSQPAITRSVRSLEAELRARLLRRTPTGVVPTQPGRALFARARAAQAELRKAEEEVDQLGQTAGSVAFGRSEEHTSELQSLRHLVCRLLLEKKKHPPPSAKRSRL